MAGQINMEALVRTAQFISGNFAAIDPALYSRVETIVNWLNDQPAMVSDRLLDVQLELRKLLVTRLNLLADRARLPGIAKESIVKPVFVIGFARTGTTLLHSLLTEDPGARAPAWWHTHTPSPPPGEVPIVDTRIEFAAKELDRLIFTTPGLLKLHPYWDRRGHSLIEDEQIFTVDFQNAYPTLITRAPLVNLLTNPLDAGSAYKFHREFLQHLQWNTETGHWVLKGIFHQFVLDKLFETYPDALCIWPHRDPLEVYPSIMAIMSVLYGAITDWKMDFQKIGPEFVSATAKYLESIMDSPVINDQRIFHVNFPEIRRDPVDVIRRAYAHWDIPYSQAFEQKMNAWLADPANRPDRYGRYAYSMKPFGLDADHLKTIFSAYRKRFGLE